MHKRISVIFFLTILAGCASTTPKQLSSVSELCRQLPVDLEFIHHSMAENNSNYNGSQDQKEIADGAFNAGMAKPCESDLDYVRAIKKYLASYHDPHINSIWSKPDQTHETLIEVSTGSKPPPPQFKLQWNATGIFLKRLNDRYFVKAIDSNMKADLPRVNLGDELLSCDGKSPEVISTREILPYVSVSAEQAARYRVAPFIFARWDKVSSSTFKCKFAREGSSFETQLTWHPVTDDYVPKTFSPNPSEIYEIEKTPYGHWIKLKSLGGYDQNAISQLKKFTEDAKTLHKDRIIVMDLRGNSGGTSTWGTDWIHNLFGYKPKWDESIQESVFVSKGNIEHYDRFHTYLSKSGGLQTPYEKAVWSDLITALHNGKLGTFAPLSSEVGKSTSESRTAFKGQVIVLTDAEVFSSAETFLEQLRMMPRVKQAGLPSNASTFYSDIRFMVTPGGLPFVFPTKKDSGDPLGRKSGEALAPDWPIAYNIKSELRGEDSLRKALEEKIRNL